MAFPSKADPSHEANKRALSDIGGLVAKGRRARLMAKLRPQQAPAEKPEPPDEDELMQKVALLRGGR
jgi:hypothetical protein